MREFTEEHFVDAFSKNLKAKKMLFEEHENNSFSFIETEFKPELNVIAFMFTHNFISKNTYDECLKMYVETTESCKNYLTKKLEQESKEYQERAEQLKIEQREYIKNFIEEHKIGDTVKVRGTLIGTRIPRYVEGCPLVIEGFTKQGNVKCRYDSETTFNISPCYLQDINTMKTEQEDVVLKKRRR